MKVHIERSNLWDGIHKVLNIVPTKTTIPILSNFLLEVVKGSLTLSATDLDISISTTVEVDTEEPGSITVPARTFAEVIRELPDYPLLIETGGERITISSQTGQYTLSGLPAEDFPKLPHDVEGTTFELKGNILSKLIEKTAFAVSTDETRPCLTGVLLQISGTKMRLIATDGHRLAKIERILSSPIVSDQKAIIPPKALNHLVRLISGGEELKQATLGENMAVFRLSTSILFSRLIEGPYPEVDQVIPHSNPKKVHVNKETFSLALKRVSILSDSFTHQIVLAIRPGSVELSATNPEIGGEAKETVEADYTGEDLDIAYNANYLIEVLKKMESGEVVFELDTKTTAGVIRPLRQEEDEEYLCVVMPMRMEGEI